MVSIHPTAIVEDGAELGVDVAIGAFSIIEAGARLGDGCQVGSHAVIHSRTTVGVGCEVGKGAVLGGDAQDLKCTTPETFLEIGERNVIREFVTIHRSNHEGGVTRVGHDNLLMAYVHLGHDCQIGNHITMANLATFGGHCQVDDRAVIGGMMAAHQYVRVGRMAMVGGMSGINQDVPPFCLAEGIPADIRGVNVIGLRRNGIGAEARSAIHTAVRELFQAKRHRGNVLEELEQTLVRTPETEEFLAFVRASREGRFGRQLEH